MLQGQGILHTEGMVAVELGAIMPNTVCQWVPATTPHPLRATPACHRFLRAVPPLAPGQALTREGVAAYAGSRQGLDDHPRHPLPPRASARAAHSPHVKRPPRLAQGVHPNRPMDRQSAGPGREAPAGRTLTSHQRARPIDSLAWGCSAASRPTAQQTWWNSG